MPDFAYEDVTEAIRNIFRGQHAFTDTTRTTAVQQIRTIGEDRIFPGRRPENAKRPWIEDTEVGSDPRYGTQQGRLKHASFIEIVCHANDREIAMRLGRAVIQCLDALSATIWTKRGDLDICSSYLESSNEPTPDKIPDASKDYEFEYDTTWKITHSRILPTVSN